MDTLNLNESVSDQVNTSRRAFLQGGSLLLTLAAEKADWGTPMPEGHGRGVTIDIRICRLRRLGQQCCSRHDLTRLAIAALHHFEVEPGLLQSLALRRLANGLNRGDGAIADAVDRGDARACRHAVNVNSTGAAQCGTTAEFGAGHAEHIAQHPQQRGVVVNVDIVRGSVDFDGMGHGFLEGGWGGES
jgi:hypothetical protein